MKILFLIRSLNRGGAERQLVTLAKKLHSMNHQVSVAVFYGGGPLELELKTSQVNIIDLKKKSRWDVFSFYFRLLKMVNRFEPDVLYSFMGIPNILSVAIKPFMTNTRTVWGVRSSDMNLERYDRFSLISYKIECFLSRYADKIICNSQAGLIYSSSNGFPDKKLRLIVNGIDTSHFKPDILLRTEMRSTWNVKNEELLIGIVARLDVMKDHTTFLEAISLVLKSVSQVRFVCVGDGTDQYKNELLKKASDLGLDNNLFWTGPLENMPSVFNMLDVLVSSSSFGEGFSNSIAEAMACGVPCVVTDVGDSAFIIGETGISVPKGSPKLLAKAILDIIERIQNEGSELNINVRKRITDNFSIDRLIERTLFELGDKS